MVTEVASRADNQVFVAPGERQHQLDPGWEGEDVMTSTSSAAQPAGTRPVDRAAARNGRPVEVEVALHGEVVAIADVEPTGNQGVVRASLRAEAGHLPAGTRSRLVDAVLDLPLTRECNRLEATLPLGDAESLDRLRERCDEVLTRPAGASCLVDAALPTDAADARRLEA